MKTELQRTADAAALAAADELNNGDAAVREAARSVALENNAAGREVNLQDSDIEIGVFDSVTGEFTVVSSGANAVRVTARIEDQPLFFAPVMGSDKFDLSCSAIAMLNPRDICFVVDLSGSMNDDTEPLWATSTIMAEFSGTPSEQAAVEYMELLYQDLGLGSFPGTHELIGQRLSGVPSDRYAYAEMTKDDGPLTNPGLDGQYRISNSDDELTRKRKAYNYLIDYQVRPLIRNARPYPNSRVGESFAYWEKYIDYIISGAWVGPPADSGGGGGGGDDDDDGGTGGGTPPPTPPSGMVVPAGEDRFGFAALNVLDNSSGLPRRGEQYQGYLPPEHDPDRFWSFNNPNRDLYSDPDYTYLIAAQNRIGPGTYVQFLMDFGRERSPVYETDVNADPNLQPKPQHSDEGEHPRTHSESTIAGTFYFMPREQPVHAMRRAVIAALHNIRHQNRRVSPGAKDRVSIVTFDALTEHHRPEIRVSLTNQYRSAMVSSARMQAASDIGRSTATQAGLRLARQHLSTGGEHGEGRSNSQKVIILLTDGVPNVWNGEDDISAHMSANPSGEYYGGELPWMNSALVEADKAFSEDTMLFPVGMGIGADYDLLDRMARLADTAKNGAAPRGPVDPRDVEGRLTEILEEILNDPGTRLVE